MTTANSDGIKYSSDRNYLNGEGETIPGYTVRNTVGKSLFATNCRIHIGSYTTNARIEFFKEVVGHELIHAVHFYAGKTTLFSEKVAYRYSFRTAASYGYMEFNNMYRFGTTAIKNGFYWDDVLDNMIPKKYSFSFQQANY